MNNLIYFNKTLTFFSLLTICLLSGLFGSEDEASLRMIPIMEIPGDAMPGWEKQIIELYHDEEGNPIPVVFRGAAKNWGAASWTPEYFAENFGDMEIEVISQNTLESLTECPECAESIAEPKKDLVCDDEHCTQLCDKNGSICHKVIIPQGTLKWLNEYSKGAEIIATYREDLVCPNDGRRISLQAGSGMSVECYTYDEKSSTYYRKEDRNDFEPRVKPMHTTIRDHVTDIFQNSKNAGYFLCSLEHNATKDQLNAESEFVQNSIFAYDYLNLETQTQFPQSIIGTNKDEERAYVLFIGSENSITSLHNHPSTFLAQIYGKKIARLVNPKDIEKCYCKIDEDDESVESCAIDITAPDFEKYPEIKNLEVYEAILEPGDVLYIPGDWLHDIRGLSTSISISSGF